MPKSLAHFIVLSPLKFTLPHCSSPSLCFCFLSHSLSLTLFLHLGISVFPRLSSYLYVVSICSLSDRFSSWFRRWEAGSISRVSVYSSWVMTLDSCSVIWESTPPQKCCFRLSYSKSLVWMPEGLICLCRSRLWRCNNICKQLCSHIVYSLLSQ